jgi:UPF0176 protein
MPVLNVAFYKFVPIADTKPLADELRAFCVSNNVRGSMLLAEEGINGMAAGAEADVRALQTYLRSDARFSDLYFKETYSEKVPFRRIVIKQKEEIVPIGIKDMNPIHVQADHIPPKELKARLDAGEEMILLDARNTFEYELGTFKNAHDIGTRHFRQFAEKAKTLPEEWKDKTVVTFCTGGIRCEKAAPYLRTLGFSKAVQLDGGILNYFKEVGGAHWNGDCFVFDYRLAVGSDLEPRHVVQCIHCQNPITSKTAHCSSCGK